MWGAEGVIEELISRGDVWRTGPGLIGLRGTTLALYRHLEARITEVARMETSDEWLVPAAISLETLARADYFASFPHWLTAASHLREDAEVMERVGQCAAPADAARREQAPATAALSSTPAGVSRYQWPHRSSTPSPAVLPAPGSGG